MRQCGPNPDAKTVDTVFVLEDRTMPRLIDRNPKYRMHRASGQAVVSIGGQDFYLNKVTRI